VNVLWSLLNLFVGYLLFRVGNISGERHLALAVFFAGLAGMSTAASVYFAKKQGN